MKQYTLIHKLHNEISQNNVIYYRTIMKHESDGKKKQKNFSRLQKYIGGI